jgi:hypothetical protein
MSRLVAFAAIQGAYNIVSKVEGKYKQALQTHNASTKVGFPNTAYYLPVIYSLIGHKVETLEDMKKPLAFARGLLPPHVKGTHHLPYLGPLLDAGMAALFAFEIEEAIRYLNDPTGCYLQKRRPMHRRLQFLRKLRQLLRRTLHLDRYAPRIIKYKSSQRKLRRKPIRIRPHPNPLHTTRQ